MGPKKTYYKQKNKTRVSSIFCPTHPPPLPLYSLTTACTQLVFLTRANVDIVRQQRQSLLTETTLLPSHASKPLIPPAYLALLLLRCSQGPLVTEQCLAMVGNSLTIEGTPEFNQDIAKNDGVVILFAAGVSTPRANICPQK